MEREPWRAAVPHQMGDLMPVDVVGDGLGQRPRDPQPGELPHRHWCTSRSSSLMASWHALVSGDFILGFLLPGRLAPGTVDIVFARVGDVISSSVAKLHLRRNRICFIGSSSAKIIGLSYVVHWRDGRQNAFLPASAGTRSPPRKPGTMDRLASPVGVTGHRRKARAGRRDVLAAAIMPSSPVSAIAPGSRPAAQLPGTRPPWRSPLLAARAVSRQG